MYKSVIQNVEKVALRYSDVLTQSPIKTKLVTNFCIGCFGDFICQATMRYRLRDDFKALTDLDLLEWRPMRSFRQGLVGMIFHPVVMHTWLMRVVPCLTVSTRLVSNIKLNYWATVNWRMGMHFAILVPYMHLSLLFGIGAFKGMSIESGKRMVDERFSELYQFTLVFWPLIMLGLYTVVPPRFGNLYIDSWNIIWQSCVSWVAHKGKGSPAPSWPLFFRTVKKQFKG